nr:regakine-1-like [Equus asinus]
MQSCIFLSCDFLTSSLLQKKLRTQISRHQRTQESLTQLCTYSLSATRRMRGSLVTLAFLLTLAALHSEASEEPANNQASCCFSFISRKIPLRFVRDYDRTSELCLMPGVIFHTKTGRQICTNPSDAWVQQYIRYLDGKSN